MLLLTILMYSGHTIHCGQCKWLVRTYSADKAERTVCRHGIEITSAIWLSGKWEMCRL